MQIGKAFPVLAILFCLWFKCALMHRASVLYAANVIENISGNFYFFKSTTDALSFLFRI
jgi:hypothetical protein